MQYRRLQRPVMQMAMTGVVALSLVTLSLVTPSGASNPYYSGSGYDASYYQCSATAVPSLGFAIIGVSHGRPFTSNSCATAQWTLAVGKSRSLYFNTGYALAYAKSETTTCKTQAANIGFSATGHQLSALQTAWAIGCSEADVAFSSEPGTPVAWWADVETGNSWSTNATLNQATITGIVAEMNKLTSAGSPSIPVGIYSTPSMWDSIVGTGNAIPGIAADWQAGTSGCPTNGGFTLTGSGNAPVWLIQSSTTTAGGVTFDVDQPC